MPDAARLEALLRRIDGGPYNRLHALKGAWRVGAVVVEVDHVQGDPFAAPSAVRVTTPTGIDPACCAHPGDRVAAEDWLLRRFGDGLQGPRVGSGRSGELAVYRPGPEITRRSAVRLLADGRVEVRMGVGLPAQGRRVLGEAAYRLLARTVPAAAARLQGVGGDAGLAAQVRSVRRQAALRAQLEGRGLVAFVADGSVLPRSSGIDPRPLAGAVPFEAPDALAVTLDSPTGPVRGLGVGQGVTLITGGGFHGKSTLLMALQHGHLDHVPGDGRDGVVSLPDTVKVRAEDGRSVAAVDVSAFLSGLPGGTLTRPFSTRDASGSTSQAAAIIEAVEAGARVVLLDEDTSATNLLVRDHRMAALIPPALEPITPLVCRARQLWDTAGVSLVMVVGGVGDFLAVADRVIGMQSWRAVDLTAAARQVAGPAPVPPGAWPQPPARVPEPQGLAPTGRGRVRARDADRVEMGHDLLDLAAVEQVIDRAHAATLGHALRVLVSAGCVDGTASVPEALDAFEGLLERCGLDALSPFERPVGDLVWPRRHEVAAALNRHRALRMRAHTGAK